MEQMYGNVIRFTTRICHGWGDFDENFKNLEQNLILLNGDITKDDVNDLKQECIKDFASNDDRKTQQIASIKLDALTNAMNNYIEQLEQVKNKENETVSLELLYNTNLMLYKERIAELQRQQETQTELETARNKIRKRKTLFSDCCGQGGNVDNKDEITYLGENDKVLNYTNRINTTKLNNDGLYPKF